MKIITQVEPLQIWSKVSCVPFPTLQLLGN